MYKQESKVLTISDDICNLKLCVLVNLELFHYSVNVKTPLPNKAEIQRRLLSASEKITDRFGSREKNNAITDGGVALPKFLLTIVIKFVLEFLVIKILKKAKIGSWRVRSRPSRILPLRSQPSRSRPSRLRRSGRY